MAGCPPEEAAALLREMARFHATWWDHPRLSSLDWIPIGNDLVNELVEPAYQGAFEPFLKKLRRPLPPRALAIAERLADKIIAIEELFAKAAASLAQQPFVDKPDGTGLYSGRFYLNRPAVQPRTEAPCR